MSLKDGQATLDTRFMGSVREYNEAELILLGLPMDYTCSFRPGTRFGPQKVRDVSIGIEEYSVYQDKLLTDFPYYDCGDLDLPFGNVEGSLELIGEAAGEVIRDDKIPGFIGGEHLVSVPVIKQVYEKYGDALAILHFDAHADLREDYIGCTNSHASAIRRLMDFMPGKNIYQFGIRSGTLEEFQLAQRSTNMHKLDVLEPMKQVASRIGKRPVYITLDIDVVDPAYANGTGTPEPGGITSRELMDTLMLLQGINLVGFDVVEISPPYDHSDRTAVLGAKLIRELILLALGYRR